MLTTGYLHPESQALLNELIACIKANIIIDKYIDKLDHEIDHVRTAYAKEVNKLAESRWAPTDKMNEQLALLYKLLADKHQLENVRYRR